MIRNWKTRTNNAITSQDIIHELGWQRVTVMRHQDGSPDVGVYSELDTTTLKLDIKARIDRLDGEDDRKFLGLVEHHLIPMMAVHDHWLTQTPNQDVEEYRVTKIIDDEIYLEKL